jgi:hypothetical protein
MRFARTKRSTTRGRGRYDDEQRNRSKLEENSTMANGSDTHIGRAESDTICVGVSPGQCVRIVAGLMEGSQAIVVQQRSQGRVLVRLQQGVYVEIQQYCLEKIKKIQ